jgi:hypothetical protein
MKPMKTILLLLCFAGITPFAVGQAKAPKKITATEAKDHVGETLTVCGKAVDSRVPRYAIGDRGKPVQVDIDEPEPNPVFYFVTFSTDPHKPQLVDALYKGKQVCVTGEISTSKVTPFIVIAEPSQIKVLPDGKK